MRRYLTFILTFLFAVAVEAQVIDFPPGPPAAPTGLAFAGVSDMTTVYNEPTQNSDGTPLNDLAETRVYADNELKATIPASSPTGGAAQSAQFQVIVPENAITSVTIDTTAVDTSDNESVPATVVHSVDMLAPDSPNVRMVTSVTVVSP